MSHHVCPSRNFSKVTAVEPKVQSILDHSDGDEGFWVADMNRPRESLSLWAEHLPSVKPFYAVKCCNEPNLLRFLADRGIGFDCASKQEITTMRGLGVDAERIVFSHPVKNVAALRYAKEDGISKLVFDTREELDKIMRFYPDAEVFLRVKPQFSNAVIQLSKKFGAEEDDVVSLLQAVKNHGANFVGFSFHVGSLCDDITTFRTAFDQIAGLKRQAQDMGLSVGFIDIGGGFLPPNAPANHQFSEIAAAIENAIAELFSESDIEFIAEPGRFISSEYMDLHLPVTCVKKHRDEKGGMTQSVYIPDGMYGSFNAITYDHAEPHFEMFTKSTKEKEYPTTLWGQTCDSADIVYEGLDWPALEVGDLLTVRKFSAYTYSPTSFFNGYAHHPVYTINEEDDGEL
jgi:ornithine decarboxylase